MCINTFFVSVLIAKAGCWASQSLEVKDKAWRKENLPVVEGDWIGDHLSKLDTNKSMDPDQVHL